MGANDLLFQRLRQAERDDLVELARLLKIRDAVTVRAADTELIDRISGELRSAAGNSFANAMLRRGPHDFSYKQLLIDVADKLTPGPLKWTPFREKGPESEESIEDYIRDQWNRAVRERLESMDAKARSELQAHLEKELRAKGIAEHAARSTALAIVSGSIAGIAAGPAMASTLFGGLWTWLFGMSVAKLALAGSVVGGPIAVAVAGAVLASGTSYSKTIPCVIRLILVRDSHAEREVLRSRQ